MRLHQAISTMASCPVFMSNDTYPTGHSVRCLLSDLIRCHNPKECFASDSLTLEAVTSEYFHPEKIRCEDQIVHQT